AALACSRARARHRGKDSRHDRGQAGRFVITRIRYLPDEYEVEAAAGETILAASLRAGIPHTHVCGGNARCSTCRVIVLEGVENCRPRTEAEKVLAVRLQFDPNV